MPNVGQGYNVHVTGLTHDERGYPNMTPVVQDRLVRRLVEQDPQQRRQDLLYEEEQIEGADVVVVSYGITSRVAQRAIEMAREKGLKVGKFRLITAWPFPEKQIAAHRRKGQRHCGGRTQSRPDGARGRACRGRQSYRPPGRPRRRQRSPAGRHSEGHHGGGAMSDASGHDPESGRAVPAHGPHAAHLVSGLRHRHQRQLLRRALIDSKVDTEEPVPSSPASAAPAASPDTSSWTRSTPRTAAPFPLPPD